MSTCPKCGAKTKEDDAFCYSCGAPLKEGKREKERYYVEREECFGEKERRRDYIGLVSFGVFLLIVGMVFVLNPNIISDFRSWFEQMANAKTLLRPPQGVITSAVLFFGLIGISNFFIAGVRVAAGKPLRRVLGDVLSGIALVMFAYLIHLYGNRVLAWQMVIAMGIVIIGVLVILYSIINYLFPKKMG